MAEYEAPEIVRLGSLREVTQETNTGIYCDKRTCTLTRGQSLAGTGQAS
jgi:hypothetical protein